MCRPSPHDLDVAASGEASVPRHKMEGAFYIWGRDEIRAALGLANHVGDLGTLRQALNLAREGV